ncbi:hypothetical protein PIB30_069514 [Stylosanthes scabra]|uniref:Uncharacterized protein n=1 Tax=Stylosanthes scabra TaxID=79078 RepID=A0ABU6ZM10_9FABA|nr:hypothetical protein [Stylosanthes scabra]
MDGATMLLVVAVKERTKGKKFLPPPFRKAAAVNGSPVVGELYHHHRLSSFPPPPTALQGRVMGRKRDYETLPLLNHGHRVSVTGKPITAALVFFEVIGVA